MLHLEKHYNAYFYKQNAEDRKANNTVSKSSIQVIKL